MIFTAKYIGKDARKGFYLFAFPPEYESVYINLSEYGRTGNILESKIAAPENCQRNNINEEVDVIPYRVAEKDLHAVWETIGQWAQFERYEVKSFNETQVYIKVATEKEK